MRHTADCDDVSCPIATGDRVVAAGPEDKEMIIAETVNVVSAAGSHRSLVRQSSGWGAGDPVSRSHSTSQRYVTVSYRSRALFQVRTD